MNAFPKEKTVLDFLNAIDVLGLGSVLTINDLSGQLALYAFLMGL